jgi:hypothetical protein
MPWNIPYKTPVQLYGKWWEPYTREQLEVNVQLLRALHELFGTLRKPWIIGHESFQKNKSDPGPSFPITGLRETVFAQVPNWDWLNYWAGDYKWGQSWRDGVVLDWAKFMSGDSGEHNITPEIAWTRFLSAVKALPAKKDLAFGVTGKAGLRLLGYHVTDPFNGLFDTDELATLWIFQKMMGLATDCDPGPSTRQALIDRLEDRGFLKFPGG